MSWADQPARMARVSREQRALLSVIGKEKTVTDEYKEQRISVTNGPDVRFKGRLLHEFSTQNRDGTKSRWTELRLWETEGGNWIAESVGKTDNQREVDLVDVAVIGGGDADGSRHRVMEHFGWTTAAKAFARQAGWEMYRRVP